VVSPGFFVGKNQSSLVFIETTPSLAEGLQGFCRELPGVTDL